MDCDIPPLDEDAMARATERQNQLTKPPGSLGRLEDISIRIAGMTSDPTPEFERPAIVTIAADHGVVEEGISAFPQEVTAQMVSNMAHDGAAVNTFASVADAENLLVDMGVMADDYPGISSVLVEKIGRGTRNFAEEPAMDKEEAEKAIAIGRDVIRNHGSDIDLIALGDMGIGNTTPSAAVTAAITGVDVADVTGRGTGIDDEGLERKIAVIEDALDHHSPDPNDGIDVLSAVGGYEIGGLAGVAIEAASRRTPVIIDGFITGAAALIANEIDPRVSDYLLPSHCSVESGHEIQYDALGLDPLFDFEMRLGEGTGAALSIPIYKGACTSLREMATFDEAGVSN